MKFRVDKPQSAIIALVDPAQTAQKNLAGRCERAHVLNTPRDPKK
jgi:hypothetical protein